MAIVKHKPVLIFTQTDGFSTGSNLLPVGGIDLVTTHGSFEVQYVKGAETNINPSLEVLSGDGTTWVPVRLNGGGLMIIGGEQTSSKNGVYPFDYGGSETWECPYRKVRFDVVIIGSPDATTKVAVYFHGSVPS